GRSAQAARDPEVAIGAGAERRRDRVALRRHAAGDLAAPEGAQGRGAGERAPRGHEADFERAGRGARAAARLSRRGPAEQVGPAEGGRREGGARRAKWPQSEAKLRVSSSTRSAWRRARTASLSTSPTPRRWSGGWAPRRRSTLVPAGSAGSTRPGRRPCSASSVRSVDLDGLW